MFKLTETNETSYKMIDGKNPAGGAIHKTPTVDGQEKREENLRKLLGLRNVDAMCKLNLLPQRDNTVATIKKTNALMVELKKDIKNTDKSIEEGLVNSKQITHRYFIGSSPSDAAHLPRKSNKAEIEKSTGGEIRDETGQSTAGETGGQTGRRSGGGTEISTGGGTAEGSPIEEESDDGRRSKAQKVVTLQDIEQDVKSLVEVRGKYVKSLVSASKAHEAAKQALVSIKVQLFYLENHMSTIDAAITKGCLLMDPETVTRIYNENSGRLREDARKKVLVNSKQVTERVLESSPSDAAHLPRKSNKEKVVGTASTDPKGKEQKPDDSD